MSDTPEEPPVGSPPSPRDLSGASEDSPNLGPVGGLRGLRLLPGGPSAVTLRGPITLPGSPVSVPGSPTSMYVNQYEFSFIAGGASTMRVWLTGPSRDPRKDMDEVVRVIHKFLFRRDHPCRVTFIEMDPKSKPFHDEYGGYNFCVRAEYTEVLSTMEMVALIVENELDES